MESNRIEFRKATADNYDPVFALYSEVQALHHEAQPDFFKKPEKDELFRDFFDKTLESEEKYLIFGCWDGEPVGYILFQKWVRPKNIYLVDLPILYIHNLLIKEGHRYQGYGGAFIDYAKRTAKELGITRMGIDFWYFNEPARKCFSRQGFEVLQHVMWLDL